MADVNLDELTPETRALIEQDLKRQQMLANRAFGEPPAPNPGTPTPTPVPTARDMSERRISTIQAVGRDHLLKGALTPKVSPMAAASSDAAQKRYVAEMTKPDVLARRQANLKGVSDADWYAQLELSASTYVDRSTNTAYKFERFAAKFEPELKRIKAAADAMPGTTLDERIARSAFVQRELAKLRGKLK